MPKVLRVALVIVVLAMGASAAAVVVSQTAWFKNWLRGYIVAEANQYLNGQLSIGRLGGNLFYGVELEDIGVTLDGRKVVAIQSVGLDYSVFHLITSGVDLDEIRLDKPIVQLTRDADGWTLSKLLRKQEQEADRQGPRFPIAIAHIGISDASIVIDETAGEQAVRVPRKIERLDATLAFKYEPVRYSVDVSHLSFRASEPSIGVNAMSGGFAVRDDELFLNKIALRTEETALSIDGAIANYLTKPRLNLQLSSDKVSLRELSSVVPALAGIDVQPAFELRLDGPLDRLGIEMNVRSSAGEAVGRLVADVQEPDQSAAGEMSVRHLNLAPLLNDPEQASDLTADARFDISAASFSRIDTIRGSLNVNAPRVAARGFEAQGIAADAKIVGRRVQLEGRASAYGTNLTTSGLVVIPENDEPLLYDLRGTAKGVNLRRLPRTLGVPPADTNVTADYHASGSQPVGERATTMGGRSLEATATFADSRLPGVRLAAGSTAGVSIRADAINYRADATVSDLDLQQVGKGFGFPQLDDARYATALNGQVSAEGEGTGPKTLRATARGTLTGNSAAAGQISELSFAADVADDRAHVTLAGVVADLDPAVASAKPSMQGRIGADLDADLTIEQLSAGLSADSVSGTAHVTLSPSTIGGLAIDRGYLDTDYNRQRADIRSFEISGPDITVSAAGPLSLNDSDQSNLKLLADSPSLAEIGRMLDVPLDGIARVEATVTGNRPSLQAAGTLKGSGLEYEENGALAIDATFTARVPDLSLERSLVDAKARATFVTVAGQEINEVDGTFAYQERRLNFDASAKQPRRTLDAAGALLMHPDHQEVHLERLSLRTADQTWTVAPGTAPTIRYGEAALGIDGLRLVSGDQVVSAEGAFGGEGDTLRLALEHVDLAAVEALLLQPPRFSGRLDASATVEGTRAAPRASGAFAITGGGFRQFKYEDFSGAVDYTRDGIDVDTTLTQNATQWITAKGRVPATLFAGGGSTGASAASAAEEHVPPAPGDGIDLSVESSRLDLGLVQGFTTDLTDVKGTLEAHVRITGSTADPHPEGTVAVTDGVMTVVPTGVTYTNIKGRVDLRSDRVHIDEITLLDNHQASLSVTGDLAVHARQVGGVQLWITGEDFKVIDNRAGNVRILSAIEITGELREPEIRGDLSLDTGRINLDEILAQVGTSPYSTRQIEYAASEPPTDAARPASPLDRLRMNLRITVPNDLVVRATDLQAPGAPIGLGALAVTLGGDLTAMKDPGGPVALVGAVNTVRGTYDFQGRRFEILRDGTIRFDGTDLFDPVLDLRTRRLIQGVEARVNVRGTVRRPEVVLSSTPPLEQADILSLIVFNQPINQLGEGQQLSLAQRAQSLAAGAVAGQLSASLGNALNLDTFQIDVAPESGGGPQLTLGQQVGQNLYVKVEQGIGDQSTTSFIIEYELLNWLRLQTSVMQGNATQQSLFRRHQGSGADLIFLFTR